MIVKEMSAVVLESQNPNCYSLKKVPVPVIGENEVLIKVARCGICMTDVHAFNGQMRVKPPVILGHEFAGTIVDIGKNVKSYSHKATVVPTKIGDRVTVIPMINCGVCPACTSGKTNLCSDYVSLGGAAEKIVDGAFAEYVKVPINSVFLLPDNMPFKTAALTEPVACCIHGIELCEIKMGDTVVLVGAGTIGLILLQLVRLRGAAKIIVFDLREERRKMASKFGADLTFDSAKVNPVNVILKENGGMLADVVIEAVGSPRTVELAVKLARKGGRINVFGVADNNAISNISPFDVYFRELKIVGTFALTLDSFSHSLALLSANRINVDSIITEELPLQEIKIGVEKMIKNEGLKKHIVFEN